VPHPLVEAARRRREEAAAAKATEAILPRTAFGQLQATTRRGVLFSVVPFAVLMAGIALLPIPGAVISGGFLTSESAPKHIQSAEHGVVEQILVRDGDVVRSGDRVLVLDDTAARAELAIADKSLDQLRARDARLNAEALNLEGIMFPAELLVRHSEPGVGAILAAERALF
jgi:multidrug efflux pump subunit AcrA (membrane-fusion protein)